MAIETPQQKDQPRDELVKEVVCEYNEGNRTLILNGSFHEEQGFTLFPVKNSELDIYLGDDDKISRKITLEEAQELKNSPHCTNKTAIDAFLKVLESDKEQK